MADQNATDLINVPQGGGALAGIGEAFQADAHTGTGNFRVPLPLPRGRGGLQPALALEYSTGNPNGPVGQGWALSVPRVQRKTDKGVPRYRAASDQFVLSGAEDLVPVPTAGDPPRYRPRSEGSFSRITHVTAAGGDYWEIWSKEGLRSRYGTARPADAGPARRDPAAITGPDGIFAWLLSETEDLGGNRIAYSYQSDAAQRHLREIRYADHGDPDDDAYLISVRIDYSARPDPFSDRRPGFELRTTQRATAIEVWSNHATPTLTKSIELTYADEVGKAPSNAVSLLRRLTITGHDGTSMQRLPPLDFEYTEWRPEARRFRPLTGELPATSLGEAGIDLVDMFGDGRPSILQLNGVARYWRNRGEGAFERPRSLGFTPAGAALGAPGVQLADMDADGRPELVMSSPTRTGYWPLCGHASDGEPAGFDPAGYVAARAAPAVSLSDPTVRLVDLDGDGRVDVLRVGARVIAAYNDGHGSFERLHILQMPAGLDQLDFADPHVQLADMTGDGLTDIVLIHRRRVRFWPNLGHGRFGPPVAMANGPDFEDGAQYDATGFDPRRIRLGDIDGDNAADVVYVGDGHVTVWINQSGNAFADPVVVPATPQVTDATAIRLADVYGTGVTGVLWTADATRRRSPYAFLDLIGGVKPYLLSRIDNHRGASTSIEYSTSTAHAEADRAAGRPWRTTLPFPVQVVERVTVTEAFSDSTVTAEYRYHHGYWDGADREFRGFARVDRLDAERLASTTEPHASPPTETRTWFHIGPVGPELGNWAPLDLSDEHWSGDPPIFAAPVIERFSAGISRRARRDATRALRGQPLRSEVYVVDDGRAEDRPYTVTEYQYEVALVSEPTAPASPATGPALLATAAPATVPPPPTATTSVFAARQLAERTTEWQAGNDPRTRVKWTGGYDAYGRPHHTLEVAVPRGRDPRVAEDQASEPYLASGSAVSYATRDDERYICDRTVATARFEVLNDGRQSMADLHRSAMFGPGRSLRLLSYEHTYYDERPLGTLGDWGLSTSTERLALTPGQLARAYQGAELPPYMLAGEATSETGIRAEYFADAALTEPVLVRPERATDASWEGVLPDPALPGDGFMLRWIGTVNPRYAEVYTFLADYRGGARAWIGGQQVLDDWAGTGAVATIPLVLTAGQPVELRIELRARAPDARLRLEWFSASQPREVLPEERLTPPDWSVSWGAEYVEEFRQALPDGAGYTYRRADDAHFDGYYETTQRHFDVQDDQVLGRGLCVWQRDELGQLTTIAYDDYQLLPATVTDPAGLARSATYDYRVFKPSVVVDPNGNQTTVAYTPLGLPAWIAVAGKRGERVGDVPAQPGTSFAYGLTAYDESRPENRQPAWVHTIRTTEHAWTLVGAEERALGRALTPAEIASLLAANAPEAAPGRHVQRREHSDGLGRLVQTRNQAGGFVIDDLGLPADPGAAVGPVVAHEQDDAVSRVIVSGWQAYDNKARVVERWEPFFDLGWEYRRPTDAQLAGLLRKLTTFYDPHGLAVRTVLADGSEQRLVPGIPSDPANPDEYAPSPWESCAYDANDNAGRTDAARSQPWSDHWNTPTTTREDALGRAVVTVQRSDGRELVTTRRYDMDGNLLDVVDPLGRPVSRVAYDARRRAWSSQLLDAGTTRTVLDPLGGAIEQRDDKGALTLTDFDAAHRQRRRWMRDRADDVPTLREVVVYGDQAGLPNAAAANLRGRAYESYDEAGRKRTPEYDFKGNVLEQRRQTLRLDLLLAGLPGPAAAWSDTAYRVDWQPPAGETLDAHAAALLDGVSYDISTTYDALQRPTTVRAPLDVTGRRATVTPTYDAGGALTQIDLDGTPFVERVTHDARGQRLLCVLGNRVMTRYAYDAGTFRLARLRSERCTPSVAGPGWSPSGPALQDHVFERDLVGNILLLLDSTPGGGAPPNASEPLARRFTYDPLYRLVAATGRETDTPLRVPPWIDDPPGANATAVRRYTETYDYDDVGNLLSLTHRTAVPTTSYLRTLTLAPASNQLQSLTTFGTTYPYAYDACGNLVSETTSRRFEWDHANRLATYRTQAMSAEPSVLAHYRYDANGHRVLKVARNQGGAIRATVYIEGLFERLVLDTAATRTEHDALHVMDNDARAAIVRIGPPPPGDPTPGVVYHLADHLGSSQVVVDAGGGVVSREEYLPYGETSLGSHARKRYRFIGRERDEESSLSYHDARYYAPWLGRWASCDPAGIRDGPNLYLYSSATPVRVVDGNGRQGTAVDDNDMGEISVGTVQTQLSPTPENVAIAKRLAERFASVPAERAGPQILAVQRALANAGGVEGFNGVGREATGYRIFLQHTHFITRQEVAAMQKEALIGLVMLGIEFYAMASMLEGAVGLLAEYAASRAATVSLEEMAAFEATARQLADRAAVTDSERLLIQARFARNRLAEEVGRAKPAVIGAYDPVSGRVVAAGTGRPFLCAEDMAHRQLGIPREQVRFTEAIRPRTGVEVPTCGWCQISYHPEQFTPLTTPGDPITSLAPLLP